MTDVMLLLGSIAFEVSTATYQSISRSTEYRWPEVERIGKGPAAQFVGIGADTITLEGVIYPEMTNDVDAVDEFRSAAEDGEPLLMVDGRGRVLGKWVITAISDGAASFFRGGVPRKITFTMSIKRYTE